MRAVTLASATRLSTLALLLRAASAAEDACTTIIVGHLASADGSTMTSHTNDCLNCDFRIGHVAARAHAAGAARRLMRNRSPYPRLLWSDEELAGDGGGALSPTYAASNTPAARVQAGGSKSASTRVSCSRASMKPAASHAAAQSASAGSSVRAQSPDAMRRSQRSACGARSHGAATPGRRR